VGGARSAEPVVDATPEPLLERHRYLFHEGAGHALRPRRGTTQELLTFLYFARGSAGEARSMLCLLGCLPDFNDLKSEISDLKSQAESISRQLRAWAESLQDSKIKGQRYLTDKARQAAQFTRGREEFLKRLEHIRAVHTSKQDGTDASKPTEDDEDPDQQG
jgi:hypothetical protein